MTNLKLYVWTGFCPDYMGGLVFAIAKNKEQAQKLIQNKIGRDILDDGHLHIHKLDRKKPLVYGYVWRANND